VPIGFVPFLAQRSTWNNRKRGIEGCTPTNISRKWMEITTKNEGVRRHVLKLDPVELQQGEEKGGYRRHETGSGIANKENKLPPSKVGRRGRAASQPVVVPRRLPSERERGRLDTIAASGGREGLTQEGKEREVWIRQPDSFPLYTPTRRLEDAVCGVWYPQPPHTLPRHFQGACQPDCMGQTNPVNQEAECSMSAGHKPQ
jgi:hypothetical protein